MIAVTWDDQPCWLIIDTPSWTSPVVVSAAVPGDQARGLTGREARRPWGDSLRLSIAYDMTLGRRAAARWRNGWQGRQNEPVLVPCWPAAERYTDYASAPIQGGLTMVFAEDGSFREICLGTTLPDPPSVVDHLVAVPLLWCRPKRPPRFRTINPEVMEVRIEAEEDGPPEYAIQIPAAFGQSPWVRTGPALGPRTWTIVPLPADWRNDVEQGAASIEVDERQIGRGRSRASAAWPQAPARTMRWGGSGSSLAAAAALLRWLQDTRGAAPCWAPTWLAECRLTEDIDLGDDLELIVDHPDPAVVFGANQYLAINRPGSAPLVLPIADFDPGTIHLAQGMTTGLISASETVLTTAALCRLVRPSLDLRFFGPDHWESQIDLREIPPEYITPSGEVHGVTIGILPESAHLVTVTFGYPGTDEVFRWTDHERDIGWDSHTWQARQVEVPRGGMRRSLALDRTTVRVRGRTWPGCPMRRWLSGLEAEAVVTIRRADVADGVASTADVVFEGHVLAVRWDGPFWEAQVESGAPWGRPMPRVLIQPGCNHALFDPGCGLAQASWECAGTVAGVSSDGLTLTLDDFEQVSAAAPPTGFTAGWLAGGWLVHGTGAAQRHRLIATNTTDSPITVTLQRPLLPAPAVGQAVRLWPGCNGRIETCHDKFDNRVRFGGFAFAPAKNPSFQPLKKSPAQAGKK